MKRIFIVLMAFFVCVGSANASVTAKITDGTNPSTGTYFDVTVQAVPNQSTVDDFYLDVSFPSGVINIVVLDKYDWEGVEAYTPTNGKKIWHRDGYSFTPSDILISAYSYSHTGTETLKLKLRVYVNASGNIPIYYRASQVKTLNASYTIDPADGKGDVTDQQGWPAYKHNHSVGASSLPDLFAVGVSANNNSPILPNQSVLLRGLVRDKNSVGTGKALVKFLVNGNVVGSSYTNNPVAANTLQQAEFSYSFPSPGTYALKAIADPDNSIAETDESNNECEASVTVNSANHPPIPSITEIFVAGQSIRATFNFTDQDGDQATLYYRIDDGPWYQTTDLSGRLHGIPFGGHALKVKAMDTGGLESGEVSQNFTIVSPPGSQNPIETWPLSGTEVGVTLGYLQTFSLSTYVGSTQQISELSIWVEQMPGVTGTKFNYEIVNSQGSVVAENIGMTSGQLLYKTSPQAGTWKLNVTGINASPGTLKITVLMKSAFSGYFTTVNYYGEVGASGKVTLGKIMSVKSITIGLVTGVCKEDDIACMGTDIIVGMVPVIGTAKDALQFVTTGLLGAGYKTVSFFSGDQAASAKANKYFKNTGFAAFGLACSFVGLSGADEIAKFGKYAPELAQVAKISKKVKPIGKLSDLNPAARRFVEMADRIKVTEVSLPYYNKLKELSDEMLTATGGALDNLKGDVKEFETMVKFLSDPDEIYKPLDMVGKKGERGVSVELWAKKLSNGDIDFSTAKAGPFPGAGSGYEPIGDLADAGLEKKTGGYVFVLVKNSNGINAVAENNKQIDRVKQAVENSVYLKHIKDAGYSMVGITGDVIKSKVKNGEEASDSIGVLTVYEPIMTVPVVDSAYVNAFGHVTFLFHTESEIQNKGWYVSRRDASNLPFENVSPFLLGWGDDDKGHSYQFTDDKAEKGKAYEYLIKQVNMEGLTTFLSDTIRFGKIVSVPGKDGLPTSFRLEQNYPNPFNPATTIAYSLPRSAFVILDIYNALGEKVATAEEEYKAAGSYDVAWNAGGLASGIYFYRLRAGDFAKTKKMTLIK